MLNVLDLASPPDWDAFLSVSPRDGNILQSQYWGNALHSLERADAKYLAVEDKGCTIAQALFLQRCTYDRSRRKRLSLISTLECLGGPIIAAGKYSDECLNLLIKKAFTIAMFGRSDSVRVSLHPGSRLASDERVIRVFRENGFIHSTWGTYIVDLEADEDELFRTIAHSARKGVNKCRRSGVVLEVMRDFNQFVDIFLHYYNQWESFHGRSPVVADKANVPEGWADHYRYCLARAEDGTPLGALGICFHSGYAMEVSSSISPVAYERKLSVQDFLHWELMLLAKQAGCDSFDLSGVNPEPVTPKEVGIKRFKGKWGGEYKEYSLFTKPVQPWSFLKRVESVIQERMNGNGAR